MNNTELIIESVKKLELMNNVISHLFHRANVEEFHFEPSPASQCHYIQLLVNKCYLLSH